MDTKPNGTRGCKSVPYPVGKLPQADLIALLDHVMPHPDPRVVFGPGLGRDAAVIDFGDRYLVTKTDPITFATDEIGWYVVNINANSAPHSKRGTRDQRSWRAHRDYPRY